MNENEELTVENLIDERVRLNREAFAAIVAFRRAKPWRGTFEERYTKFQSLMASLTAAYGLGTGFHFQGSETLGRMGNGAYDSRRDAIVLVGKLSVVTFLHCFARARGKTREEAFRWSLSVFKKMFPISFSRCRHVGPYLIREQ